MLPTLWYLTVCSSGIFDLTNIYNLFTYKKPWWCSDISITKPIYIIHYNYINYALFEAVCTYLVMAQLISFLLHNIQQNLSPATNLWSRKVGLFRQVVHYGGEHNSLAQVRFDSLTCTENHLFQHITCFMRLLLLQQKVVAGHVTAICFYNAIYHLKDHRLASWQIQNK